MLSILKLNLRGYSAYRIARKLEIDPPTVYASLKAARKNFAEADKMLMELKAIGWPEKTPETKQGTQQPTLHEREHKHGLMLESRN
jgi:hypothetical protein